MFCAFLLRLQDARLLTWETGLCCCSKTIVKYGSKFDLTARKNCFLLVVKVSTREVSARAQKLIDEARATLGRSAKAPPPTEESIPAPEKDQSSGNWATFLQSIPADKRRWAPIMHSAPIVLSPSDRFDVPVLTLICVPRFRLVARINKYPQQAARRSTLFAMRSRSTCSRLLSQNRCQSKRTRA